MIVEFDRHFEKSIKKLKNQPLAQHIEESIINAEQAINLHNIHSIKKLVGFKDYYRIRIGDYRVGIKLINSNTIRFILVAHRKDIYKLFP